MKILRLATALLAIGGAANAAEVRVMISAGFYGVYSELAPAFERASGHKLVTTRGPSMGDSPEAIPTRLARGEPADVVIMDGAAADELAQRGLVRAGSKVELAKSQVGMVVRQGAAKPDIGSVDAFRQTLLSAKSIAYSDSGSGTYLSTKLFPKLGVADQIAAKSRKVRGPPSGEPVAAVVARGESEIGFQQVSELIHVPGVSFVGPIPAELQPGFSFAGAITTKAAEPDAATALLRFLSSAEAAPVLTKAGLAPPRAEPDPQVLSYKLPGDLVWNESPTYPGLRNAILYGDPTKPVQYAVRNRFAPNSFSRPHYHPNDRIIVVLSGTWWVGTGDKFDPDSTKPMPAGSVVVHYAGKVHYDGAKDEPCEVIIYGMGPATTTRVGQ